MALLSDIDNCFSPMDGIRRPINFSRCYVDTATNDQYIRFYYDNGQTRYINITSEPPIAYGPENEDFPTTLVEVDCNDVNDNVGNWTDSSGTYSTSGTPLQIAAASIGRKYLFFQKHGTDTVYLNIGGVASVSSGSIVLDQPNQIIAFVHDFVPDGAISIFSATAPINYTLKTA